MKYQSSRSPPGQVEDGKTDNKGRVAAPANNSLMDMSKWISHHPHVSCFSKVEKKHGISLNACYKLSVTLATAFTLHSRTVQYAYETAEQQL